jgi:predicted glycosyltransferase
VLTGPNLPQADFTRLQVLAGDGPTMIDVIRSVPDLPACLAGSRLSISQAGYNTVADILAAGCPAVLVPFASGGETEQTMRAGALAASGRAAVVHEDELTPENLTMAIRHAVSLPVAPAMHLDGGARTATILLAALHSKKVSNRRVEKQSPFVLSPAGEPR